MISLKKKPCKFKLLCARRNKTLIVKSMSTRMLTYLNEQLRHETSRQNDHMTWILTVHAVLVILMSVSQWIGDNNRLS